MFLTRDPDLAMLLGCALTGLVMLVITVWLDPEARGGPIVADVIPIPQKLVDSHQPLLAAQGAAAEAKAAKEKAAAALATALAADQHASEILAARNAVLASELVQHQQREREWFRPAVASEQLPAPAEVPVAPAAAVVAAPAAGA